MTITITEDDAPDGHVEVSFKVDGFDIEEARVNSDLPAAVLLGAAMMRLVDELPSVGGRIAPSKYANIPTRQRRRS
jgi:hypothetical protein